MVILFEAC